MTALEFLVNGELVCTAGINADAGVLTGIVNWLKKEGETEEIFLMVSGMNSTKGEQYNWKNVDLKKNDEIVIRIVDSVDLTAARVKSVSEIKASTLESKLKSYYKLKEELKDHIK